MRKQIIAITILFTSLVTIACSCSKDNEPSEEEQVIDPPANIEFIQGIDLSYVNQIEMNGGVYKENDQKVDPFKIFKSKGASMVRFRLWHNPEWIKSIYGDETLIYSGFEEVASGIKRAKENNLSTNLDFHYSDIWADPSHQTPPKAWEDIKDIDVLCDSVYNYTHRILWSLYNRDLLPEMVQIGNETNCGMMHTDTKLGFPDLSVCNGNWINMGKVLNAGIKAVREIDELSGKTTLIALHVADPKNLDWWFSSVINKGGVSDFDVAGFSYYHIWHTDVSFENLPVVVEDLIRKINKDVVVLETAYPFTTTNNDSYSNIYGTQTPINGYPYSIEGQKQFMTDLCQNMINAGAKGVMYWEPAWITSNLNDLWGTGSAWENCAFFDYNENVTEAIDYMNHSYSEKQ